MYHMSLPLPPSLSHLMAILPVSTIMYRVRGGGGEGGEGGEGEEGGGCSAEWGREGRGDASVGVSVAGVRV